VRLGPRPADLVGREIAHRVVLSRTPVLRQRVADHSRAQFLRAGLPLLPVELVQRAAFQSMTYTGKPPWRQEGGEPAAANVASLVDAILEIIGMVLPGTTGSNRAGLEVEETRGRSRALHRVQAVALQAAVHLVVEQLVVAQFVGRDLGADLLQDRLGGRVLQGAVVGAGPRLDDAARHHLARLAAAHRLGRGGVERQMIARLEAGERGLEIPARIGELRPAAECHAVLGLLGDPLVHFQDEIRIVGEDAAQIDAVVVTVALDHGRSLDVANDLGVDLRRVEAMPIDRLESPVAHRSRHP